MIGVAYAYHNDVGTFQYIYEMVNNRIFTEIFK